MEALTKPCLNGQQRDETRGTLTESQTSGSPGCGVAAISGVLLLAACGAADQQPEQVPSNLQAVVSVERSRETASEDEASGTALAQFLVLPAEADSQRTLDWAGLRANLPGPTRCWRPAVESGLREEISTAAPPSLDGPEESSESLELLAAGEVIIRAGGERTELALNLFPPSGSASGVLYSSRDRSAVPLPADESYQIDVSGSPDVPPLTIEAVAPMELTEVQLDGEALEDQASMSSGEDLNWTWLEGASEDRVYVHLSDEETAVVCAFEDHVGSGTIPSSFTRDFASDTLVRVDVHRVREVSIAEELRQSNVAGGDATMVETTMRFDFQIDSVLRVD